MGICAVLVWSLGTTFARGLTEEMGTFTAGAIANFLGGVIMLLYKKKTMGLQGIRETPRAYWLACGICFVAFSITVNLSIGLAYTREQVITSGLLRLIWPLLALILTIPLHKKRVSKWFVASATLSLIGIVLGNYTESLAPQALFQSLVDTWIPSLFAFLSSILWALYSNFLGKYAANPKDDHVGLLMLLSGLIQGVLALLFRESPQFAFHQIWGVLYMAVVVAFLGNFFWVSAMQGKRRHAALLFANLTPLLATVAGALTLGVPLTLPLVVGSALVAAGTIWSKYCFLPDEA